MADVGGETPEQAENFQGLPPREDPRAKRDKLKQEMAEKRTKLASAYKDIASDAAFVDLVAKMRSFADYHLQVAKDGVGWKTEQQMDQTGNVHQINNEIKLTPDQRLRELDRAGGIQEIVDYVDRLLQD